VTSTQTYDVLDNLAGVVQGLQSRTFAYSSLSRLVSTYHPESGTTTMSYDDAGNLLSKTDARGWAQTFLPPVSAPSEKAYDGLGRPRRKRIRVAADGTTSDVTWTWDTVSPNGKGRLASVSYGGTTVSYSGYDILGRVTSHSQTTDGVSYPFSYEYYRNDALKSVTYPGGRKIDTSLDTAGRPTGVTAPSRVYAGSAAYAAHGALRQVDLSSSALRASWATFNARLQVEQIKADKLPSPGLAIWSYTYGGSANNGNPQTHTITDASATRTQAFTYDAANRLSTADETGGYTQTYNYDAYGNRWLSPGSSLPGGAYQTTSQSWFDPLTNRLTSFAQTAQYDAAGNITAEGTSTFAWDGEGRLTVSTIPYGTGTVISQYSYDGEGRRVKKQNQALGKTVYVHDAFGQLAVEYPEAASQHNQSPPQISNDCAIT
jgi:YD repeat-containing protein